MEKIRVVLFDDNYDLAILQGVADGIYDVIQQWSLRKTQQQEQQ